MEKKSMYYPDYLQLEKILEAQDPESFKEGNQPAHDEMLFIIIHQAYELWFKQILYEMDFIVGVFKKESIDDNSEDLNLVRHRLNRIIKILELLNQQVGILDTMTPLDFLEFRNLLNPASGFQSLQFRKLETRLGLKMESRHNSNHYKHTGEGGFTPEHYNAIRESEEEITLLTLVNKWLERMPFFETDFWDHFLHVDNDDGMHPFWSDYREIYLRGLSEREANKIQDFDLIFFEKKNDLTDEQIAALQTSLSPAAMRSALFIMLYRDFPVFQTSYQLLDALLEIDNLMGGWRHKHLAMVRRMIGMRMGTGNSSGAGYLEGALTKHYIFKDIAGLSTFIIQRKQLPKLPAKLISKLSYNISDV